MNRNFCHADRSSSCGLVATHAHPRTMANIDDDSELLPIPLDGITVARLVRLARACGDRPAEVAASLLRDLLADDEALNDFESTGNRVLN